MIRQERVRAPELPAVRDENNAVDSTVTGAGYELRQFVRHLAFEPQENDVGLVGLAAKAEFVGLLAVFKALAA